MPAESKNLIVAKPRINPVAQYLIALAAVIATYTGYLKFAVPAIEGPPNLVRKPFDIPPIDELSSPHEQKSQLIPLLPADAWELSACSKLLIDAGTILFKEIERQDDGSLQIVPFTLISGLENDSFASDNGAQPKTPIVLRCLSGAKLKFNKPLRDLFNSKAKMESASLKGRVDIYRPPSQPDRNDAIHVVTSNVQIDKHRIYTLEQVQFAFGPNQGRGRNMQIDLAHNTESSALADFSSVNGIRRFKLAFLDRLRVESPKKNDVDFHVNNGKTATNSSEGLFSGSRSPLDITCKGPFVFDFESKTASFRDQVVAEQVDAFKDNIHCDELLLVFDDKPTSKLPSKRTVNQSNELADPPNERIVTDLQLQRFIAKGSPAIVISRSRSAKFSGEYLSYNVLTNQIDGSCSPTSNANVTIVSPEYQMVAKQLTYQIAEDGSLGELNATGPGYLLHVGNSEQGEFYSAWQQRLTTRIVPEKPGLMHVVVDGSAKFRIANETSINADRLEMMVWQIPKLETDENEKVKRSWEFLPSRLFTTGNVTIVSPELDGQADHLTATWPKPTHRIFSPAAQNSSSAVNRQTTQLPSNGVSDLQNPTGQLAAIPGRPVATGAQTGSQPKKPKRKLNFKGETVDVRLTTTGDASEILDLTVVGNVSIESVPIVQTGSIMETDEGPLTIKGHRLQLTPQSGDQNYRTLISGKNGGFASVSAKDFELTGQNINLDQNANKVWVEGSGSLRLKTNSSRKRSPAELAGQLGNAIKRKATPEILDVSWKGGMIFDGAKIYFEHSVEMSAERVDDDGNRSKTRSLCEGLSVELSKPVQFQNLQSDEKISDAEIRKLILVEQVPETKQVFKLANHSTQLEQRIKRPVMIENRTFDINGEISEQQTIAVPQAVVNRETGVITSKGPGTVSTHRKSKPSANSPSDPFGHLAGKSKDQNKSGISFIQINFDGEMTVDAESKEMRLDRNIRTVYSPVQNWDVSFNPDNVRKRTPGMVFLTCDNLLLAHWAPRGNKKKTSEMIATGNTNILNDTFEATAARVSYDKATDMLVIVGTPRNDANLWFKQTPNDQDPTHLVAKKITYRVKDQATRTYGLESLKVNRK